jgi:hypothetical protein
LTSSKVDKFKSWQVQKSISSKVDEFESRRFEVSKLSWVMTTSVVYEWADPVATTNWPSWHQTGKGWVLGRYSKTLLRQKFIPWDQGPILWNFLRSQFTNVCNKLGYLYMARVFHQVWCLTVRLEPTWVSTLG